MLINYSVENFMSFKDRQVFSMIAGKYTKHSDHVVESHGKRVLKGSFFFGANASGKSNLFESINFAQHVVMDGLKNTSMVNRHFRIDPSYAKKPGVFEFDLSSNGHFYSYGFAISYDKAIVEEEWLYLCDSDEIAIFERSLEDRKTVIKTDHIFSDHIQKQSFDIFAENVPDDKMLLLEISERKLIDHPDFSEFKDVITWFQNLAVLTPDSSYREKTRLFSEGSGVDLEKTLKEFDTGIEKISVEEEDINDALDFLSTDFKEELIKDIDSFFNEKSTTNDGPVEITVRVSGRYFRFKKENNQILSAQLKMDHGNSSDLFELSDESDGTQRLFNLVPVYQVCKAPKVIFVDELDRSFHTKLTQRFIQGFYTAARETNSQFIASVHDSNIMDLELLRQDEIWFVERQGDHSSKVYSLNKFKERFDKKVAKDYLLGRYGAIPCFKQLDESGEEDA